MARTWLGRPIYTTEAYLVDGLLVDSGCPATGARLAAWCRGQPIRQVVNTHHHEDHSGGNAVLRRELGLTVAAAPAAVPILADFPHLQFYRRLAWGQPANVTVDTLGEVVETEHYGFEVIPTPGHCPDHVCLWEPREGWLFSGDLFVRERVRYLRADEDMDKLLASLRRALALRPQLLVCSHSGLVEDACGALQRKIDFWQQMAEQVRTLHAQGLSPRQITARLSGSEGLLTFLSAGHFSKINLVRELLEVDDGG